MKSIRRALISVSDKTDLITFAKSLVKHGVEIISTGGTLKALKDGGVKAIAIDEVTGFPEILEGRVKTLHPKIHGGLLYRRDKKTHVREAKKHGIEAIDLVVVNLYPFEIVTSNPSVKMETAIENIDIGGPSMLRSAAKNYEAVTVVCDPADYAEVTREIEEHHGKVSAALRQRLALKVFQRTSAYDRAIADFLESKGAMNRAPTIEAGKLPLPSTLNLNYRKTKEMRYGENPHQRAAFYMRASNPADLPFAQLHGKELSFNNLLDIEAALDVVREFEEPAACVIKHSNPCGVAEDRHLASALEKAIECDAMSAFGGIIGINRPCTLELAKLAFEKLRFFEVFVAPSFEPSALTFMKKRENLRLIEIGKLLEAVPPHDLRFLQNGVLLQDRDRPLRTHLEALRQHLNVITQTKLDESEIENLLFAFKCVKIVKSNAIVITQGRQTVGIGAGQMSRVDSVDIACRKAGYRTENAYLASDAFFPMPDSIEVAAEHKIRAIIQPGGSLKDADVVAACDRFGIAMVMTGQRHFRH